MAQRLIKVAKELNVGTSTIVDHLSAKGFDIQNKPTSKISDEMYDVLLQEFQKSIAIKKQADELVIGHRNQKDEVDTPIVPAVVTPAEPVVTPEVEAVAPPVKSEPEVVKEVVKEVISEVVEPTPLPVVEEVKVVNTPPVVEVKKEEPVKEPVKNAPGLKILGKIDLDSIKHKGKPKKEVKKTPPVVKKVEPIAKKPVVNTPPPVEKKPDVVAAKPVVNTAPVDHSTSTAGGKDMVRAATPELRGLKILGKIEIKDPKKDAKPVKKDDDPKKRRRRTRKKLTVNPSGNTNRGGNRSRPGYSRYQKNAKPEVKEVSKKEIEDKIKATLAKLSGSGKKKRQKSRRDHRDSVNEKSEQIRQEKEITTLQVTEFISVTELASIMNVSATDIIMTCMNLGEIVSINQRLDAAIIELLGDEFGHEIEFIDTESVDDDDEIIDSEEDLLPRAPIVTIMGHVDHGKTSLLDYIRSANVADGEAGGITQHIGAYSVRVGDEGKKITFLDTPGHEAFTAMRARGAKVTDIAVIIVAADDNIMPQTKEAISHAQAAGVPIIFAINKIDKPGASPERIKQELANLNLLVEEWGGTIQSQDIAAKLGTNVDLLLEKILLEAEIKELKANPNRDAIGTIIEASLDKGRGYTSKVLIQTGTLKIGDIMLAGQYSGKVKALYNDHGKKVKTAGPSTPVLVLGLDGAPQAGDRLKVTDTEQEARRIATNRAQIMREQANRASKRISLDEIARRLALGNFKELNLIVKGDVDGSIEALSDSLIKQSIDTVQVNVIHKAVGQIIESDVLLASASDAIIIGFQVRPSVSTRRLAEQEGVEIKLYSVIYKAIDEIRMAIEGLLEPTIEEKIVAQIEVRETYKISKVGTIAGAYVTEGKATRNNFIRVIRDGIVVYPNKEGVTGEFSSLKRFKDDVKEVRNGFECGITIKNFNDIRVDDVIECYETVSIKQTLDSI